VAIELKFVLLQQIANVNHPLLQPFQKTLVNFIGRRQISGFEAADGECVKVRPIMRELGDVRLQKVKPLRIEFLKIAVEKLFGCFFIQRLLRIVLLFEHARREVGIASVVRPSLQWHARGSQQCCVRRRQVNVGRRGETLELHQRRQRENFEHNI